MFATVTDVAGLWRPLDGDEKTRATMLLKQAAALVRATWPDVDARVAAGALDAETVAFVEADMVRAVLAAPQDNISTMSQTAGPYSVSWGYRDTGRLRILDTYHRLLDARDKPRARMGWAC